MLQSQVDPACGLKSRQMTPDERDSAWRAANFFHASTQEKPIALWILGPSAVGKSTIAHEVSTWFDVPLLGQQGGEQILSEPSELETNHGENLYQLDAVLIDGEFIRLFHDVWRRWVKTDDWRSAYPAMKADINAEKEMLQEAAIHARKHLIIPSTALHLARLLKSIGHLIECGYTNHVVAVLATLEECQNRGVLRESSGKRYNPKEFDTTIVNIPPMIKASNGRFRIVRVRERNDGIRRDLVIELISDGLCPLAIQLKVADPALFPHDNVDELASLIRSQIRP